MKPSGPLQATEEQLRIIAAAATLAPSGGEDSGLDVARAVWPLIRDMVLDEATEASNGLEGRRPVSVTVEAAHEPKALVEQGIQILQQLRDAGRSPEQTVKILSGAFIVFHRDARAPEKEMIERSLESLLAVLRG